MKFYLVSSELLRRSPRMDARYFADIGRPLAFICPRCGQTTREADHVRRGFCPHCGERTG